MATYNHAEFVAEAIDSVLGQRAVELEFLIADDGSSDRTSEVVASNRDSRIRFFPNNVNRGACVVTNELIQRATGEFIALVNSDDYWIHDDKLAQQLAVMHENPRVGACFGRARFIDLKGSVLDKETLPHGHVFDQHNRSRGAWLRHFFDNGNCLCHPTVLIRRACYGTLGMYDNRLRQLPDFDMWLRLAKRYDIHVSDRELVAFRALPGRNTSSVTTDNVLRTVNECYLILQSFFDGVRHDTLLEGFGDKLVKPGLTDDAHIQVEQTLLFLGQKGWGANFYNLIGLERLHRLMGSDTHRQLLIDEYGINDLGFHTFGGQLETFNPTHVPMSSVKKEALIAELNRRALRRGRSILQSALTGVMKRS
jgi:glycosyltransferase involved in cell wall biosynthesis